MGKIVIGFLGQTVFPSENLSVYSMTTNVLGIRVIFFMKSLHQGEKYKMIASILTRLS